MKRVLVQYLQYIANNDPSWELRCLLFIPHRENWDVFFSSIVVRIEMSSFHPLWELRCLLFIPRHENWDVFFSSLVRIEMPSFHPQREIMRSSSKRWKVVESLGQWKSKVVVGYLVVTNRSLMKWRFWVMTS